TQIVQSAWPWVLYDRGPVQARLATLKIVDAPKLYNDWSAVATAHLARRIYRETQLPLFVLVDSVPGQKGYEPWTQDSRLADPRFGCLALAFRPTPQSLAESIFSRPNPEGHLTHAQFLLFNRNPQEPLSEDPRLQPRVGWDTLNWSVRVP